MADRVVEDAEIDLKLDPVTFVAFTDPGQILTAEIFVADTAKADNPVEDTLFILALVPTMFVPPKFVAAIVPNDIEAEGVQTDPL